MQRALLNLAALRASRSDPTSDLPDPSANGAVVTRRRALGLAGGTVAGASPALRAVESALLGSFELVRTGKGRVAFLTGGLERWVIDVRRFAGSPALRVAQTADQVDLKLQGARYPGTDIPADLQCVIRRGVTGWRILLEMSFGGFSGSGYFLSWLAGQEAIESRIGLKNQRIQLGDRVSLLIAGDARAAFTPDWMFALDGKAIASLHGLGAPLLADTLRIGLPSRGEQSLLATAMPKRTTLALLRGGRRWQLQPAFKPNGHWRLITSPGSFDLIQVELGEGGAGHRGSALVAEAGDTIVFQPHSGLKSVAGEIGSLRLSDARYAIAFDAQGDHRSLVARYDAQSTWLSAGACAVEVGHAPGTPPFELVAHGSTVTALRCTPAVLRVSVPIAGASAAAATAPAGTHLAFVARGLERPGAQHAAQIVLSDHPESAFERFTLINLKLPVIRPDDLLALTFEFINMKLDTSAKGKPPVFVRRSAKLAPYLAVHIQGQNIAEQAFFRVEPSTPIPTTPPSSGPYQPVDPDAGKGSKNNEFPDGAPHVPVDKRLADESRLVFAMPPGFTALPVTLDALLDWAQYIPSVSPTALPAGEFTKAKIAEPLSTETSLEIPWRLKISPNRFSGWIHSLTPVTHNGWTELWHTRLGVKVATKATKLSPGHTYLVDTHYAYEAQDTPDGKKYTVTLDTYAGGKPVDLLQAYRTIRAVWSQDFPPAFTLADNTPFRMSLTGRDRLQLVELTSFFDRAVPPKFIPILPLHPLPVTAAEELPQNSDLAHDPQGPGALPIATTGRLPYNPLPVQVNRLMLTTLGAWVDVHGAWPQAVNLGIALEEWTHKGTQARDNYVRVVYKGYLFPLKHPASLIKITERKFYVQNGRNVAYLFQRMFIVVREPIVQYGASKLFDGAGRSIDRAMPFKQIQITTITTPDLDPPALIPGVSAPSAVDAFWPQINGKDFLFHCIGQDQDGQRTEFTAPLAFISVDNFLAYDETQMAALQGQYASNTGDYPSRHTRPMGGAKVAFAQSNKPGDTTLHTTDITFDVFVPSHTTLTQNALIAADQPRFVPVVASATVGIPAVEALLRTGQKPQIKLSDHYLKNDLGGTANIGEVFAEILDATKPAVTFGGSNSGGTGTPGTVTPNLAITALSRLTGPVGGNFDKVADGSAADGAASDVTDFLKNFFDNDAKILGAVPLSSIIKMPSLKPLFQVLSLIQSIESAPDTLNQLLDQAVNQAINQIKTQLASLTAQAMAAAGAAIQNQLAPFRSALDALQSPLNTLKSALNSIPSVVLDLLGDLAPVISDLSSLVGDLTTLISDLDTLMTDLGTISPATISTVEADATALETPVSQFVTHLQKLVTDIGNVQGLNPLPLLKHGQLPTAIDTTLSWSPHLQDFAPFKALDKFLSVTAKVHIPLDGSSEPSFSIVGTLGKIGIDLANIIYVGFAGLTFSASSGEKPDVNVPDPGVEVMFEGPLSFVNDLKDAIPSNGFTDPPFLDITADGVAAGFTFDLPSLGVGIFSLDNISLGAKVTIPFIGSSPAQVYFNFCTREKPFILTVSMLGGGGFFGISLGLDGLDMMEASFEFGAELSLDFGIASGSVSIMAGIYFKMEKSPKDQTILTGFVHIHGDVEVLGGIISASIDVELDLTYEKDGHDTKVLGDATLTISVHIVFFSISVSASVHREFSGSHNDPTFADQVSEQQWNDYLLAFA